MSTSTRVTALAGGVGAARFLQGLERVIPAEQITVIGNTGDDEVFHGLHVSPDLDTVVYTLAGASNTATGWGLATDTFRCMEALERYGEPTWFRLGDLDLATHLFRTRRLRSGATLSEVTAQIVRAWNLGITLLPMSDEPAPTRIETADGEMLAMQEWFVAHRAEPPVAHVDLGAASAVRPADGVVESIDTADTVIVCPSNPVISIGPILAVPGVRDALAHRRDAVVGISPIVGGSPVRGPADRLLRALGLEVSAAGVASMYAELCGTFVFDEVDAHLAEAVDAAGSRPVVCPTLMHDTEAAERLARAALGAVETARS